MPIKGYMRASPGEGGQLVAVQRKALETAGVPARNIYADTASGKRDARPGFAACLKALRPEDTLVVWRLDRIGGSLGYLVKVMQALADRAVGLRVLTGQGATIDTTATSGKLVFGIFAALAEFEREVMSERARAARLNSARGRGRKPRMTVEKVRLAMAAMQKKGTVVADLCKELGINRATLYRHVSPNGELRATGKKVLGALASSLPNERNHLKNQVEKFLRTVASEEDTD